MAKSSWVRVLRMLNWRVKCGSRRRMGLWIQILQLIRQPAFVATHNLRPSPPDLWNFSFITTWGQKFRLPQTLQPLTCSSVVKCHCVIWYWPSQRLPRVRMHKGHQSLSKKIAVNGSQLCVSWHNTGSNSSHQWMDVVRTLNLYRHYKLTLICLRIGYYFCPFLFQGSASQRLMYGTSPCISVQLAT